jgi:hypothetical protein
MAVYAAQAIPKAGLNATYNAAAGGGDRVPPGSIVHVKNGNAAALTVTLVTLDTADGDLVVTDRACTSITGTTGMAFIRIPVGWPYVDPADGLVGLSWSVTTTVTFAVVSAP